MPWEPERERREREGSGGAGGRDVSARRKGLYYAGTALTVLGFLLFGSVFVTGCMNWGDFTNFDANAKSEMARGIGGMALVVVGSIVKGVGARGAAGSGLLLDPQRARKDLEPYARMTGGLLKDTLEEANVDLGRKTPEKVVMVKCRACGKLNEEESKFCQECGEKL
jgi:hypothetical protein